MSWLNLNQSLSSLKGQITNFASEVLSEGVTQDTGDNSSHVEPDPTELHEKCRNQELEIAALKRLTSELEASLQSERLARKNGVKEEESNWYWDPPAQGSKTARAGREPYTQQTHELPDEGATLKERDYSDTRPDFDEELHRLREENKNLTNNLEDLDSQHQLAMERLLTLKRELQNNFEVLKQEHEDLKNTNDESASEIQNLLSKIGERDKEVESLKTTKADLDTLHHKYMNLEKIHSLLKENAEKFQEENQELHEEVFKLQEQVTKVEHEVELATKHSEMSNVVPRERYDDLMKELNDLKEKRHTNQLQLDELNIDDNAKSVIETLKRDISELKHKLAQKEEHSLHPDRTSIKSEKVMHLYNKYVNFELPVDYIGEMPSSEDNVVLFKLESVFKTVNSFKKEIDILHHKLSEKNHTNNHLQTQIDDLTTENDFLTSDMQHFERELTEMKKNNDFLISEIAALKNTSKLEPIIETHEDNLAKLENELADSNRLNSTFEFELKRIARELSEVQAEKVFLQDSLNDLKNKYTGMLNELETCKNKTQAVADLEGTTNTENTEKLKKADDEIDELKKRLHAAHAKNEQMSIDIHIIENDKVLLTKEVDDLNNALREKNSSHKELEDIKLSLDAKLQNLVGKLDEVINHKSLVENDKLELEKKVTELETATASAADSQLKTQVDHLTTEKNQLFEKFQKTIEENATLSATIDRCKIEIDNLKQMNIDISHKYDVLKNSCQNESHTITVLQETIDKLKKKVIHQEALNSELVHLKDEHKKLIERKLQLETELVSNDNKIMHLEEEFEKLIADINEKDTIIETLNSTLSQNSVKLTELNKINTDLENSIKIKNIEIHALSQSLKEVTEKLSDNTQRSDRGFEELKHLHTEKEDITKQMFSLNEELSAKNAEISELSNNIQALKNKSSELNTVIENKDKEIKELNQSIVELTDKIKTTDNTMHQNDDYAKVLEEKRMIEKEIKELKYNHNLAVKELLEIKSNSDQLQKSCVEYRTILENATKEKTELVNLITLKHNESLQYHAEIQRLNHVLLEQTNEFKKLVEEKDNQIRNQSNVCPKCEKFATTSKEKDEIIMTLNQNIAVNERATKELLLANETVRSLTERCDNLDKNLATQLELVRKLTAEKIQLSEQEQNSTKELERLRVHLVEKEESYTQELMTSEQRLTECQARLHQVEERFKQNSTVYTSNSIRANQEVETLRNQIKLLEKQREDVQTRLSDAEDARGRSDAALTNLQVVLEQFQLDKERDVHAATEKIRNKMEDLKRENKGLQEEISKLKSKLDESLAGLKAATRLGDQVETKTAQINDLKEQVRALQTSVSAAEERYRSAVSNQQDKVDKNLVKNLVINYVVSAANTQNKTQVLRILSTVLDFNQQECEKLGLSRAAAGDSLAAEFVKFLQDESRPRPALPAMGTQASRSSTPVSRKSSVFSQPPFEPGHSRAPSTGSNNLLFQTIDSSAAFSFEAERDPRVVGLDTGVTQTRNTEGAILKSVLKDM